MSPYSARICERMVMVWFRVTSCKSCVTAISSNLFQQGKKGIRFCFDLFLCPPQIKIKSRVDQEIQIIMYANDHPRVSAIAIVYLLAPISPGCTVPVTLEPHLVQNEQRIQPNILQVPRRTQSSIHRAMHKLKSSQAGDGRDGCRSSLLPH